VDLLVLCAYTSDEQTTTRQPETVLEKFISTRIDFFVIFL
jgi:hypothetical protein